MTPEQVDRPAGHAFISYVREDAADVDRLQRMLEAAGIRVWRDTENLWPGQDWKTEIKAAITNGSLAFIACFSEQSQQREKSYQNEELILAVEQMRQRTPGRSWLIPVRFSECTLPQYDLGAGRSLDSIQRVDLFDQGWEQGGARLVAAVMRILGALQVENTGHSRSSRPQSASISEQIKSTLLANDRQIELEDLTTATMRDVRSKLKDESSFPADSPDFGSTVQAARLVVDQAKKYTRTVEPLIEILVPGCRWGRSEHEVIWARLVQDLANANRRLTGKTVLTNLQRFAVLPAVYAAGMAALSRHKYGALRAITTDAKYRSHQGSLPVVATMHPWAAFENAELAANVLAVEAGDQRVDDEYINSIAIGRRGKRFTPVSDYLHDSLRPFLKEPVFEDDEYTELFDELEVLLAMIATDEKLEAKKVGRYMHGAWYGSFTWRDQHMSEPIEQRVRNQLINSGDEWPPLKEGLFGGSSQRAEVASEKFVQEATEARQRRF